MHADRWGTELAPWLFGAWLAWSQGNWWPFICIFLLCFALNLAQWALSIVRQRRAGG